MIFLTKTGGIRVGPDQFSAWVLLVANFMMGFLTTQLNMAR